MSQPQDYRKKFAISQSALKDWKTISPKKWYDSWILGNRPKKTSQGLEFGNLLDTIIFNPELFEKRFILCEVKKPSDKIALITRSVFDHISELNKNAIELNEKPQTDLIPKTKIPLKEYTLDKDIVKKYCVEHEFWVSNLDRAYNSIVKDGSEYFEFLTKVGRRIVITDDQNNLANDLKNKLLNDPVSRGFFVAKNNCEVIFQQQIFADFELSGLDNLEILPLKGMLDIIHINHKRKEVREVDLKYTNDTFLFHDAIRRFDYSLQHSFYDFLIRSWIKTYKKGICKDYTVAPPLNVVIDDQEKIPYLYGYSQNDLAIKRSGIEGTKITGWEQTLEDIAWHVDTNQWDRPRSHYLNGFIPIEIFNKK